MNPLTELLLRLEILSARIEHEPKFFHAILADVNQLMKLSDPSIRPSQEELRVSGQNIEKFFNSWRPTVQGYTPPLQAQKLDATASRINQLLSYLTSVSINSYDELTLGRHPSSWTPPQLSLEPGASLDEAGKAKQIRSGQALENTVHTAGKNASSKTVSILFMDVSGWSKLDAERIHRYVTLAMPKLAELMPQRDFINSWGDAIVATFSSVKEASESALRIRDFFRNSYSYDGIAEGLTCRISLHLGEALICQNPFINRYDIFGDAVHLAARLEPMTLPGQIFCTKSFAERLEELRGLAPKPWPLPQALSLPKDFGTITAYVVAGVNEPDPRPMLSKNTLQAP